MDRQKHIDVVLADDHMVYRTGLRTLLNEQGAFHVVAETGSGRGAIELAKQTHPDVVVMDARMPDLNGIEATTAIKRELPGTAVVMTSAFQDETLLFDAIQAGADSYVGKEEEPAVLLRALLSAALGRVFLPPSIAQRVLDGLARGMAGTPHQAGDVHSTVLTPRELTLVKLLAQGKPNRDVSALLGITDSTLGSHIGTIYNKLQVRDRSELLSYALRKGLIEV